MSDEEEMTTDRVLLERSFLQDLRKSALKLAAVSGLNPLWVVAYRRLATAADCLDAMHARTELPEAPEVEAPDPADWWKNARD